MCFFNFDTAATLAVAQITVTVFLYSYFRISKKLDQIGVQGLIFGLLWQESRRRLSQRAAPATSPWLAEACVRPVSVYAPEDECTSGDECAAFSPRAAIFRPHIFTRPGAESS